MSVDLGLHFPWKRYHATPWGRYVNEGAVEIPPSPWRILRALYSVWQLRAPDLDADTVHGLLQALAVPPDYTLPPYRLSHTRHYLPDSKHRTGSPSTDLALDAFAVLGGNATIGVHWPITLPAEQEQALARLATSLPYLGRADSQCQASTGYAPPATGVTRAVPLLDGEAPHGMDQIGVLAPAFPFDLDALTAEVTDTRGAKLVYPAGSRLVPYAVPAPQRPQAPARRRPAKPAQPVTTVRFSLLGKPRPQAFDAVAVTDALRSASIKALAQIHGQQPVGASNLLGKDAASQPLKGHQHAHYLALTDTTHITGLAIWTPGHLAEDELAALNDLARHTIGVPEGVQGPRGLHVRINAYGDAKDVLPDNITGASTTWVSATPFLPSRWRPRNTTSHDHLVNEINRELTWRNLPTPVKITELPGSHWARYRRHRWSPQHRNGQTTVGTRTNNRPAFGLRLDFPTPVPGPLVLGDLSHFGLSLFRTP
ncbi:type I-G CRISPR-associated protein Csb2 [Actinomadura macrotermitis]|uniref:Type I-U CRISPR-associated protein Cas5/Cas6 n=1 Tax=Actinomadura macrotermitis TaxID=2585200 RepID=A0A7K0BT18_9ACTN|nr:type I-U CRISPR-associated protein Csb2 [Actinomadura macrotermitis]MQY04333.1 hypothetical protein [Actinomadura macrotermitis]